VISTPAAPDTTCPGCGKKKTKRAQVCAECRRKANSIGVSVVTHVHEAAIPSESPRTPRTPWQSKAYHGKCNDLARLTKAEFLIVKRNALARAPTMFGREIKSSTELTEIEMELLLEWLDVAIDDAKQRAAAAAQ
jgi:hypothetical protein